MPSTNVPIAADVFNTIGSRMMRKTPSNSPYYMRRFRSFFGVPPNGAAELWTFLPVVHNGHPKHLLWALSLLKIYATEHILASFASCDEKTFRQWAWAHVRLLSDSRIVSLSSSFSI